METRKSESLRLTEIEVGRLNNQYSEYLLTEERQIETDNSNNNKNNNFT